VSRAATSYVIGYHGCERDVGIAAVSRQQPLIAQDKSFHWLGAGVYFWENDQDRALEWAQEKASRDELKDPFVIGAILDLGNCLDLQVRENAILLRSAYDDLLALTELAGKKMPKNKAARKDQRGDKVLRFLDCAVINHLHTMNKDKFDSVRGLFVEGDSIYPDGGLFHKTHVEIAIRRASCIIGIFLPPPRAK
jgi:hypothetical protein